MILPGVLQASREVLITPLWKKTLSRFSFFIDAIDFRTIENCETKITLIKLKFKILVE